MVSNFKNLMALFEKKQQLEQEGLKEKPEKIPPPKEEEKDTSAFQEKSYLKRREVRDWLKGDEIYKIIPQPKEKRAQLEKGLFGPKYGSLIERAKKEPERLLKEIETGKVKPPAGLTKHQAKRLLKKFLGK
jgi:hypothetical protein